jgi:hypothetical protein
MVENSIRRAGLGATDITPPARPGEGRDPDSPPHVGDDPPFVRFVRFVVNLMGLCGVTAGRIGTTNLTNHTNGVLIESP